MYDFLRNSNSISNQKAITTLYSDKSKNHTLAGQFYLLRVLESVQYSDFSVQLLRRWEAPSKDNANTTALNTKLIKQLMNFLRSDDFLFE